MRALTLALLLINLLFFGWAHWIDVPPAGHAGGSAIPPLELPAPPPTASEPAAPAAPAATGLPALAAATTGAGAPGAVGVNPALRCATLGPFSDRAAAAAVSTALQARNLGPRERPAKSEVPDGFWVYVDNLPDSAARTRALKRLEQAGVRDAAALVSSGQVSVGLFNEKAGADMRAAAVRGAGLEPVIEARTRAVDEYWFDVDLAKDIPLPAVAAVVAGLNVDAGVAWRACPLATP